MSESVLPIQLADLKEARNAVTRLAIQRAREDLLAFVMLLSPEFSVGPHHRIICDELMKLEATPNQRVMLFLSPRSSKSTLASIYFPAWAFGRRQYLQWIQASHSEDLAAKFGREVREILNTPQYQIIFPDVKLSSSTRAALDWTTADGRKSFFGAGTQTKIAGHGYNIGSIDDPISEQDAYSEAKREMINQWYPGGMRTRRQPNASVVITMTRWGDRDPAGYLLDLAAKNPDADQWRVVEIPALNTIESTPLLNAARQRLIDEGYLTEDYPVFEVYDAAAPPSPGMCYWPAPSFKDGFHWGITEILATKANLPPYQWDALYMQRPSAIGGSIYKTEYWQDWREEWGKRVEMTLFSLDTAYGTSQRNAYSAITYWGLWREEGSEDPTDFNLVLLGAWRGHWGYADLKAEIQRKFVKYKPDLLLIENKASGQSIIPELTMAGLPVQKYNPDRDKVARAQAAQPTFFAGKVYTDKEKQWAQDVIEECRRFPSGHYKDYPDTVAQAVLWFRQSGWISLKSDQQLWTLDDDDDRIVKQKRSYY